MSKDRQKQIEDQFQADPSGMQLVPFYEDAKNELVNPDRIVTITWYELHHWLPRLGPTKFMLIQILRRHCYYNKLTRERRDWCYPKQETIAKELGVSPRTVWTHLNKADDDLKMFIRREATYAYDAKKRKKVRSVDKYHVKMDTPLIPEHEGKLATILAERIVSEETEKEQDGPIRKNCEQVEAVVDNSRPTRKNCEHISVAETAKEEVLIRRTERNVNVPNVSENLKKTSKKTVAKEWTDKHEGLLYDMSQILGSEEKNKAYYRTIVLDPDIPEQLVRYCMSITREACQLRKTWNAPGYFTGVLKNELERLGLSASINFK